MFYLHLEVQPDQIDHLIAALWEAETLGIVEGDGFLEAFFLDAETARHFGTPLPAAERDWVQETKDAWPPWASGASTGA